MMVRKLARALVPAAAAAAAALSAGCGAKDAVDPVAQAADTTDSRPGGIGMVLTGSMTVAGETVAMSGTGTADRRGRRGAFTLTVNGAGQSMTINEVQDGQVVYARSDALAGKLPGGRHWLKFDLAAAARRQGVDITGLGQGPGQDPAQALDYLRGVGSSKRLGKDTVRGVPATHYHVDVNLRDAAEHGRDEATRRTLRQAAEAAGNPTLPIDVWVDDHDLVRRERVRMATTTQGQRVAMDMTVDFVAFGVPVKVKAPAASDTADLLQLMGGGG
jgi:hypothetical protein